MPEDREIVMERMRLAIEMHDTGVRIMRQNLRRAHPHATEGEIDALLAQWMRDPPGDAEGAVGTRAREAAVNSVDAALFSLVRDLAAAKVRWALVGGIAVSVRTESRFTKDVAVAVAVSGDLEAEACVRSLGAVGWKR